MSTLLRNGLAVAAMVLVVACSAEEGTEAADTAVAETAENTLDAFTGTWQMSAVNEAGDSLPGHVLHATADTSTWTITFPDRAAVPVHVVDASGNLAVLETDAYESVLRPGVQVTVTFVHRAEGDELNGRLIAHYDVAGATAILRGRVHGTRQP